MLRNKSKLLALTVLLGGPALAQQPPAAPAPRPSEHGRVMDDRTSVHGKPTDEQYVHGKRVSGAPIESVHGKRVDGDLSNHGHKARYDAYDHGKPK